MNSRIYKDGQYEISQHGLNKAVLTNGGKKVVFPLCMPAEEIPQNYLESLRRANQNPADYFFVGVPGDGTILRRAALPAWEAAVAASKKAADEEKAVREASRAAEIAAQGRKALMFHGPYATKASLVIVRPATDEEKKGFAEWYQRELYIELETTEVSLDVAERLHREFGLVSQGNGKHTRTQDSCIFFLTDEQWNVVLKAEEKKEEMDERLFYVDRKIPWVSPILEEEEKVMSTYRIIVRKEYASLTGEYSPGDYLRDDGGRLLGFDGGEAAMEYARKHEGEAVVDDGVLDWWLEN